MPIVYQPNDVFIAQRNATSTSFVEVVLPAVPNSYVIFNSASVLTTVLTSAVSTASYALTSSVTLGLSGTASYAIVAETASYISAGASASYALTASVALNVPTTASYAIVAETASFIGSGVATTSASYSSQSDTASFLKEGANIYLSQSYIRSNISASAPAHIQGQLWWDTDNHTYTIDSLQSRLQIGQESYVRVVAGEAIPDGAAVFVNGAATDPHVPTTKLPIAWLALADALELSSSVIGLSTQQLDVGEEGFVTTHGNVNNLNTFLFTDSDVLYLTSSITDSGSYSTDIPPDPYPKVSVGTILYSHPTIGRIFVNVQYTKLSGSYSTTSSYANFALSGSHSTTASYVNNSTSASYSVTSSYANNSTSASYSVTASWALNSPAATSASHAIQSDSSSYIVPGATFYVVSSSTNPSYIEPYNIPTVPYTPPYKEGRLFYDKDYSNWVYYPDQNFKLHIGKEVIWRVYNGTGTTLATGTPVYLSGSTNGLDPDVYPAIADGTNTKSDVVGVMRYTTTTGNTGYIMQAGVIHNLDMTGFTIGDEIFLSSTVLGGKTNVEPGQPYESVRLGFCQVGGADGSLTIGPSFKTPPVIAYAGMTVEPVITSNGSGSIYISTGSVNLYNTTTGHGGVLGYPLVEKSMSLISGSTNYIVAELSASLATYTLTTDSTYANGINIVRVATLDIYNETTSSWDVHKFQIGIVGLALANRINNKDILLYGYQRQNGLTLFTTGSSGSFGITNGTIWYGPNAHSIEEFNTTVPEFHLYLFHTTSSNGTSSWHQHTSSIFFSGYYDSGSGDNPIPCAPNSWSVNFVYRLIGTDDEAAIVLSSDQFADEATAIADVVTPVNLPSTIVDVGLLVGRLIVQSGSYNATVESAFTTTFGASSVTDHESLTGLQGGAGGDHKHLTGTEYIGTGTGVFMRNNQPVFAGVSPDHIPYWKSDGTLTLTGSLQVVGNEHVLINSASFPDPTNPETLLIRQTHTGSVNALGVYTTHNDFSQIYIQNNSTGNSASTDLVATSDTGSQYTHYVNVGIANSKYTGSTWPWVKALDGYLLMDGGDLWLALNRNNRLLFAFNNISASSYADSTGFYLSGSFFGTSSRAVSSSYSISSSYVPNLYPQTEQVSASWASASYTASIAGVAGIASGVTVTGLGSGQYNVGLLGSNTGNVSVYADNNGEILYDVGTNTLIVPLVESTASWAHSSSFSKTSSYASGIPVIKSGIVSGASFVGNPKTASVVFTTPFSDNNYSVVVTGESSRTWVVQSKVSGSFIINSNNNTALSNNTFWQAIQTGEYYS